MDGLAVSAEVVTAGTALAGLTLIYIGALVTGYGSHQPQEQRTVKLRFLSRAWTAFAGLAFAFLSAALAVVGKWLSNGCVANVAVWMLLAVFIWAVLTAVLTIREIR